jgi:hypothetical protein
LTKKENNGASERVLSLKESNKEGSSDYGRSQCHRPLGLGCVYNDGCEEYKIELKVMTFGKYLGYF